MQITITNDKVLSILNSLVNQLELPIEKTIELCIAFTDTDKVIALSQQLSAELQLESPEATE